MKVNYEARALAAERKRTRTRAALIQAAMRVIAEKGPDALRVADIVAEAGVSRGGFYNYFPAPEDLLLAVAEEVARAMNREIEAAMADVDDPAERLAYACLRFLEIGTRDPVWGWVYLRMDTAAAPQVDEARRRFEREFLAGVEHGRFRPADLTAGYSLAAGGVRMAVRAILNGAPMACGVETVRMMLIGLGLDPAEAQRVCRLEGA